MGITLKKSRVYDPPLTLKIVNEKINYNLDNDYLIRESWYYETNALRKNGYLAFDSNGEELGIIFADDDKRHKSFDCAYLLFFKKYTVRHNVGVWRVIKPTDKYFTNTDGYITFNKLENLLSKNGSLTITTKSTFHN